MISIIGTARSQEGIESRHGQGGPAERVIQATTSLLSDMASRQAAGAELPRVGSPTTASEFSTISKGVQLLGTPSFPLDGLEAFNKICDPLNRISVGYSLYNSVRLQKFRNSPDFSNRLAALMLENAVNYQNELASVRGPLLHCQALHIPLIAEFVDSLPPEQITSVRVAGIQQMRLGIAQIINSATTYGAICPQLKQANRRIALESLNRDIDLLVPALSISQRTALKAELIQHQATIPSELQSGFQRLVSSLDNRACTRLCQL